MKNVLGSKEFWKTMTPFLPDNNTVKKFQKTELYLMTLICLKSLARSLKMRLGRSMSNQMNIIKLKIRYVLYIHYN